MTATPRAAAPRLPVAILAGGLATRLRPVTERVPKLLVEVAGEPFFSHQLRLLRGAGLTRIVLLVGHLGERIVDTYGDGAAHGVEIEYVFDGPRLLGTGGALVRALPRLGDAFLVLYGDSFLPIDYAAVERAFLASGRPGLMTVYENRQRYDRSNVHFADGRIVAYNKRRPTPEMRHIDYGLGAFRPEAFSACVPGEPLDLADVQTRLAEQGLLAGFEVHERFYEIGSPEGLAELDALLRTGQSPTRVSPP